MDGINVHDASMVNGTAGKSGPEVYPSPTPKGSFVNLGVERKYAGKESDLLEKQNKLDQQRTELNNKYKLPERQFANHQSDEKRKSEFLKKEKELADRQSKLDKDQQKLAARYNVDSERRTCRDRNCILKCPSGSMPSRNGCVGGPTPNPPTTQCNNGYQWSGGSCVQAATQCSSGYRWNGSNCEVAASNVQGSGRDCGQQLMQLRLQKDILQALERSQMSVCAGNSGSSECSDLTSQVTFARAKLQTLQDELKRCMLRP